MAKDSERVSKNTALPEESICEIMTMDYVEIIYTSIKHHSQKYLFRYFQYLTAQSQELNQLSDHAHKLSFTKIDDCFSIFGLDITKRRQVYKIIAAILHLGNISFEESTDNTCEISKDSHTSCRNAAELLSLGTKDLQSMLINNSIDIKDSKIR